MSETAWIALAGIAATLLATFVPLLFQARQSAIARRQWFAEFAIKRQYEIVHNLQAAALSVYSATLEAITAIQVGASFSEDKTYKVSEAHIAFTSANNLASVYLAPSAKKTITAFQEQMAILQTNPSRYDTSYTAQQFELARYLLDKIAQELVPILNPPVVQNFLTKIQKQP